MNAGPTRDDWAMCALHCPLMFDVCNMKVWKARLLLEISNSVLSAVAAEVELPDARTLVAAKQDGCIPVITSTPDYSILGLSMACGA